MAKVLKNLLSDYGYNLVALPKEDIQPLLLLYKNGDAVSSVEDSLEKLFKQANAPVPTVVKDKPVTNIDGSADVLFDAEGGVSMIGRLLEKLNLGKLNAKLKVEATHKVKITYENIKEDKVSLLELDGFITDANPDTARFGTFKAKLENSELYVINNVLKSNSFSIVVEDANGTQLNVEADIKNIVNANVNVSKNKNNAITLKHNNPDTIIVFAFKAQKIIYDQKKWWEFYKKNEAKFHIKDQQGVVMKNERFPTVALKTDVALIDM
jgi:hypothetical protein